MQPNDSPESISTTKLLQEKGISLFDLTSSNTRFRSLAFNSRANKSYEKHRHYFVGEVGCGRWGIIAACRYLSSKLFYWMYDCSALIEILEYQGNIHQLQRWV